MKVESKILLRNLVKVNLLMIFLLKFLMIELQKIMIMAKIIILLLLM